MSINLIYQDPLLISFLLLILFEYILDVLIEDRKITIDEDYYDAYDSPFVLIIIIFIYFMHFLSPIMSWKLLWQLTFIMGLASFIVMFFIFTFQGYRDIIKLIKRDDE